ncbi:MAG: magnesium/cobalt transporter CorA [Verrucomicrobiota bacterium]|nr:magnesium/cobalt transporter CorA [Verrucomicrobiota bacterium]
MKRRKHTRWNRKYPVIFEEDDEPTDQPESEDQSQELPSMEIGSSLGLAVDSDEDEDEHVVVPGAAPGIDRHPEINVKPANGTIRIRCIDYGVDAVKFTEYDDIDAFLLKPKPTTCAMRWINVDGINPYVINKLKEFYHLHTLAAEDTLNTRQRPKIDAYEGHLYIAARMLMIQEETLKNEHLSIFVLADTLITIQEETGDVWDPIRDRLKILGSRLRTHDTSFLLYSLMDALVDHLFPIMERYGELLEEMESATIEHPDPKNHYHIFGLKRELNMLRRVLWPMREIVDILYRDEKRGLPLAVKPYLRDVLDHCSELLDLIDNYRDMAASLTELMLNASTVRMNEVIKMLTVLATFFIPTTFLASVYGMNFKHFPELDWKYGYYFFWVISGGISATLLYYFNKKGWLNFGK